MSLLNTLDEYTLTKIYKMVFDGAVVGVVDKYIKKEIGEIIKLIDKKKMVDASDRYVELLKQFKRDIKSLNFIIGSFEALKRIHQPFKKILKEMKRTYSWDEDGEETDAIDILYAFETLPYELLEKYGK